MGTLGKVILKISSDLRDERSPLDRYGLGVEPLRRSRPKLRNSGLALAELLALRPRWSLMPIRWHQLGRVQRT